MTSSRIAAVMGGLFVGAIGVATAVWGHGPHETREQMPLSYSTLATPTPPPPATDLHQVLGAVDHLRDHIDNRLDNQSDRIGEVERQLAGVVQYIADQKQAKFEQALTGKSH